MDTFEWEAGVEVEAPYVEIDGTKHYLQAGTYSGGTPVSEGNLNEMQNILNDNTKKASIKKMATVYLTSDTTTTASRNIPFTAIKSNTDLLTLSDGGIKIGAGIKYVAVSGQVFLASTGSNDSYLWTEIRQNTTSVSVAIDNYNTYFASTTHAPRIIEVQENDVIYLKRIDSSAGIVRSSGNTYLSVEILEEE